jgi:hypothetical protein
MATQDKWYLCVKCYGLYYDGNPGSGACSGPARMGETSHLSDPSMMYILQCNEPSVPPGAQEGWRWCQKCEGLWFAGNLRVNDPIGKCPADPFVSQDPAPFGHSQTGSWHYFLLHDIPSSGELEDGWRWCKKCWGLWHGRGNSHGGDCPADTRGEILTRSPGGTPEEGHVNQGSWNYVLTRVSIPG